MHAPYVPFRFPWAVVALVVSAGPAGGLACSSSGSAPAPSDADGNASASNFDSTGPAASSSGGEQFAADAGSGEDASDSGPTCTGDGGPQTFTCTGSMAVARDVPAGAALPDGSFLVAGGWNATSGVLTTAEVYDPARGTFSPTGSMAGGHLWGGWGSPLPTLPSGKVLVAGGLDASGELSPAAELYDPATGTFSPTGPMLAAAISMFPVALGDGSVLYVGGWNSVTPGTQAELPGWSYTGSGTTWVERYVPALGVFQMTGSLAEDRLFGCNVRLSTGKVLAIAGAQGPSTVEHNVESYDLQAGTWSTVASFTGAPFCADGFALPNGKVLLTGTGGLVATLPVPGVLLFDPSMNPPTIGPTTNAIAGFSPAFVQLGNGNVLALGGTLNGAPTATAQVYDVQTNAWKTVGSLNQPRAGAIGAFLLPSGEVLVVGGTDQGGAPLATAEIYVP